MFQFPGFPTFTYVFSKRSMILHHGCSHIRTSPDQCLFAAPRSFSQLVTSFIGSQCQGILHMLFFAWTTLCFWSIRIKHNCSRYIAWIAVFHTLQLLGADWLISFRPWQNCLFYPLVWRKNLISNFYRFLCFFPLLLSVMYVTLILFRINMFVSYSVFNELQLNFH